jgi:glycosyltransferase involved in cell wall biosynthesis
MKIIIPMNTFGKAGGYRVLSQLSSHWVEMGHTVIIIAHYSSDPVYFPTKADIVWIDSKGKETEPVHGYKPKGLTRYIWLLMVLFSLIRGIENYGSDADIVLANQSIATPLPVWLSRVKAKKFYYVQAYEPEAILNSNQSRFSLNKQSLCNALFWMLSSISYLLGLHTIVNSPIYYNYKLLRAKEYVPPGIDLSIFHPQGQDNNASIDWRAKIVTIGCISRKEAWKCTGDVLGAFDILKQQNYNVKLLVAYGNLPEDASSIIDMDIVVPKNDSELADFYRSLDIMIAPGSIQLGAPHYPVMEAMACGIPVITTGYLPASLEKNNAWIVPIHDINAIAEAVKDIIFNSTLRNTRIKNGIDEVQNFSWDIVSKKMIFIFSNCLKNK